LPYLFNPFFYYMARRRKSPVKGFLFLAAAIAGGAYFGDDLKEKFHSVLGGLGKK
jgi:hypothetical protein